MVEHFRLNNQRALSFYNNFMCASQFAYSLSTAKLQCFATMHLYRAFLDYCGVQNNVVSSDV